jgi:hypothetical protein
MQRTLRREVQRTPHVDLVRIDDTVAKPTPQRAIETAKQGCALLVEAFSPERTLR